MYYQQSMSPRARAPAPVSPLTNPAWIAANRQGSFTPEQLDMLAKEVYSMAAAYWFLGISVFLLLTAGIFVLLLAIVYQFLGTCLIGLVLLVLLVLVGFRWLSFRVMAARNRFKRNVATGDLLLSLAQEQGEVVWGNTDYLARSQEQFLSIPRGTGPLIPGPYHFYSVKNWVKNGSILVSAQPIHTETQMLALPGTLASTGLPGDEQARLAIQQALCATVGFSLLDLEANRRGYLTQEQIWRLPRRMAQEPVQSVEGEIELTSSGSEATTYYYQMGNLSFIVPDESAHKACVEGIRYRVYYLARRKRRGLLSVEPLEAPRR